MPRRVVRLAMARRLRLSGLRRPALR
jgi:hypothetical protein